MITIKKIIVEQRTDDVKVYPKDHPEVWGCAPTINNAIGDMIMSHTYYFGIVIEAI